MIRNDRKIIDFNTGVEIEQHKILKMLFQRSGLKRDEWHEKAEDLAGRPMGSPTKLSDIFNGQSRSLPMRDIVPYIQALGMRKIETDYYIGEFFKAYCDENFHQYISTRSKPQHILALEQRLKIKDFELKMLRKELLRLKHVDIPLVVYQQKTQSDLRISQLTQSQEVDKNQHPQYVGNEFNNEPGFKEYHDKQEELSYDSYYLEETMLWVEWYTILNLIKYRIDDLKFIQYVSLFIPENFEKLIKLSHETDEYPMFRSEIEVLAEILSAFKKSNLADFQDEYEARKEEIISRALPGFAGIDKELESSRKTAKEYIEIAKRKFKFRTFVLTNYIDHLKNIPSQAGFLMLDFSDFGSGSPLDAMFNEYIDFESRGLGHSVRIEELFQLQNPSASVKQLRNQKSLDSLIAITHRRVDAASTKYGKCNPLDVFTQDPDFPKMFFSDYKKPLSPDNWLSKYL